MTTIAIDGVSGSGKSSAARAVARRLDLPYLDTGAMYRAVALAAIRSDVSFDDQHALVKLAQTINLQMDEHPHGDQRPLLIHLDGVDVTADIRGPLSSHGSSAVAVHPGVRQELVGRQRAWVQAHGGGVVEGRDIATVVCPDADLKVYLTADVEERARRRSAQGEARVDPSAAAEHLKQRDERDSGRAVDPLQVATDAVVIDTTSTTPDEVVELILSHLRT